MWPFDQNQQQRYQQYAQAYDKGDYSSINPQEAQGQIQQFVQNAPANEIQEVFRQHFANLDPNQRAQLAQQLPPEYGIDPNNPASLAQGVARLKQERPQALQQLVSHPILVAGAAGLAAVMAKHMLNNHR